jgi:hypothetical protein
MKTQFIQIQDISEIDTTKVNVYDLNKRYIDRAGNMYGLRYNRDQKKIEIIKIMRTTARNQQYFAQKMMINKKDSMGSGSEGAMPGYNEPLMWDTEASNGETIPMDTESFRSEMFAALLVYKERITGIVKNISNVPLIPREQRDLNIKLDDLLRNLDIDGVQRLDKVLTTYREMTDYPRSVNYYLAKLDARARSFLSKIPGDEAKLKFIIYHETASNLREIFYFLSKVLSELNQFMAENKDAKHVRINQQEKQSLSDAMVSMINTITDLQDRIVITNEFERQLYNAKFY